MIDPAEIMSLKAFMETVQKPLINSMYGAHRMPGVKIIMKENIKIVACVIYSA